MKNNVLSSPKKLSRYFLTPYYGLFAFLFFIFTFSIITNELIPWCVSQIVNLIQSDLDKSIIYHKFNHLFFELLGLTICSVALNVLFMLILQYRSLAPLAISIRLELFSELLKKNLSFWHKNAPGTVWNLIEQTRRIIAAHSSVGNYYYCLLGSFCSMAVICYLLCKIFPLLMFVFILLSSVTMLIFNYLSNSITSSSAQWSKFKAVTNGKVVNLISNFFLLKIFGTEKREQQRLTRDFNNLSKAMTKHNWRYNLNQFYLSLLILVFRCLVLIYAVWLWINKYIQVGDVIFVMTAITNFSNQLISFGWFIPFSKMRTAVLQKGIQTFAKVNEINDDAHAKKIKVTNGLIKIKNLNFAYHHTPVLENINLTIKPKEKIGIVGLSGGGKTTLLHLLLRIINTPKNSIFIDGQDITSVTQESLHKAIAFIPQDTSLFHRSIMENLKYGSFAAKSTDVLQAAHNAFADVFINSFPQKYNTLVGDKGVKLSGGERQRVGIARAFLKNSPILLLDEATSALDSQSEHYIQKAIQPLFKDKTVIVVAHRLSTLKNMDRIIVLDQGQIIEEGPLSTLLKKGGKFADLWALQKI